MAKQAKNINGIPVSSGGGGSGVETVTGTLVDNTDPLNPIVNSEINDASLTASTTTLSAQKITSKGYTNYFVDGVITTANQLTTVQTIQGVTKNYALFLGEINGVDNPTLYGLYGWNGSAWVAQTYPSVPYLSKEDFLFRRIFTTTFGDNAGKCYIFNEQLADYSYLEIGNGVFVPLSGTSFMTGDIKSANSYFQLGLNDGTSYIQFINTLLSLRSEVGNFSSETRNESFTDGRYTVIVNDFGGVGRERKLEIRSNLPAVFTGDVIAYNADRTTEIDANGSALINRAYADAHYLGGGTTNLGYTPSPTNGIVTSDTGTDATIPLATGTDAGLLKPADFTQLSTLASDLSAKAPIASPTFTGTTTTPAIVVSSETASTIASFDASKNIKSLSTATYPSLTELSYAKGVTSAIQSQIDGKVDTGDSRLTDSRNFKNGVNNTDYTGVAINANRVMRTLPVIAGASISGDYMVQYLSFLVSTLGANTSFIRLFVSNVPYTVNTFITNGADVQLIGIYDLTGNLGLIQFSRPLLINSAKTTIRVPSATTSSTGGDNINAITTFTYNTNRDYYLILAQESATGNVTVISTRRQIFTE